MKICICGKGGSGKSIVVALLAQAFRHIGKKRTRDNEQEQNLFIGGQKV